MTAPFSSVWWARGVRRIGPLLLATGIGLSGSGSAAGPQPAVSDPCAIPIEHRATPPKQADEPVRVDASVVVVDLFEISNSDQAFRADIVFTATRRDPRLAAAARGASLAYCGVTLDQVWHPDLRALNMRAQFRALGESVRIADDGTVRHEKQVLGLYSARFKMQEFPFDDQELRVQTASFSYGPDTVRLVSAALMHQGERHYSIAGWHILSDYADNNVKPLRVGHEAFSRLDHVILVERHPGYYLWNFVLPLILIVLMAWTVFWLDPTAWQAQIGIATASAFTLVAFLIALRNQLPPVPYLTRLDELILGATILVFLAIGQVIVTSRLVQAERQSLARRCDAYGRWIYIVSFAGIVYYALVR